VAARPGGVGAGVVGLHAHRADIQVPRAGLAKPRRVSRDGTTG
jgi:hypothetical protein